MLQGHQDSLHRAEPFERERERRILAAVQRCQHSAQQARCPAILRLHLNLTTDDPWAFLDSRAIESESFFAWNDGRTGLCAAAFGKGEQFFSEARDHFSEARQYVAALRERLVEVSWHAGNDVDPDLPLAFAGFAFDSDRAAEPGLWTGWPNAAVYVPPVLVYRRHHRRHHECVSGAVVHLPVAADAAAERVLSRIGRVVQSLRLLSHRAEPDLPGDVSTSPADISSKLVEDRDSWCRRVEAVRSAASAGLLDKVVLARAADYHAPAGRTFDAYQIIRALRRQHRAALCFAIGRPGAGCFLGATPEILAQVSGHCLTTQALAGTAPRHADPAVDASVGRALAESAKDRREHAVVSSVLRQTLAEVCQNVTCPDEPRLVRLAQVQHLETPFRGTLRKPGGILDLVERLHPTPSVGGWPAGPAKTWLAETEPLFRGWYAAPIGWMTARGDGVFAVAIRSLLVQRSIARAYAGAGIVAASDPLAEWHETELKLRTVREAFRLGLQ